MQNVLWGLEETLFQGLTQKSVEATGSGDRPCIIIGIGKAVSTLLKEKVAPLSPPEIKRAIKNLSPSLKGGDPESLP